MAHELELFLTRLEQTTGHAPRRSGDGWQAHCPAHDDQRASLSIRSGTLGRVLVHCHAGCTPQAICQCLELDLSALMPEESRLPEDIRLSDDRRAQRELSRFVESRRREQGRREEQRVPNERTNTEEQAGSGGQCPQPNTRPFGTLSSEPSSSPPSLPPVSPTFPSRDEALRVLTSQRGAPDGCWEYHNQSGECIGLVVRWNTTQGKAIRPLARVEEGWIIGAMPAPRPLYALQEILPLPGTGNDAERLRRVYVVEGEKAADAGRSLGLVCTTSSGGAAAAQLTDWSPLAGRDVVLLPDQDEPGRKYAAKVTTQLVRLKPLPSIRTLQLPDLSAGDDLADFVVAHADESPDEIVARLTALADQINPISPAQLHEEPTPMSANSDAAARCPKSFAPQAVFTRLAECTPKRLHWLWPGRVPLGKLTLLIGDPGLGKSFVTLDVAARVSRGQSLPALEGETPSAATAPGSVVLLSAEDDALDTIHPRLAAAGADLNRIDVLKAIRLQRASDGTSFEAQFSLQSDVALLEDAIAARDNCRLVVIDPITAYLGRSDSHRNSEMRALLGTPLRAGRADRRGRARGESSQQDGPGPGHLSLDGKSGLCGHCPQRAGRDERSARPRVAAARVAQEQHFGGHRGHAFSSPRRRSKLQRVHDADHPLDYGARHDDRRGDHCRRGANDRVWPRARGGLRVAPLGAGLRPASGRRAQARRQSGRHPRADIDTSESAARRRGPPHWLRPRRRVGVEPAECLIFWHSMAEAVAG